jgi:hypothetical protein
MPKFRQARRASFTARSLALLGYAFIALGALVAIAALIAGPRQGMLPAVGALLSGILAGLPLVAISHLLKLVLEQRRSLHRLVRAQRRLLDDLRRVRRQLELLAHREVDVGAGPEPGRADPARDHGAPAPLAANTPVERSSHSAVPSPAAATP